MHYFSSVAGVCWKRMLKKVRDLIPIFSHANHKGSSGLNQAKSNQIKPNQTKAFFFRESGCAGWLFWVHRSPLLCCNDCAEDGSRGKGRDKEEEKGKEEGRYCWSDDVQHRGPIFHIFFAMNLLQSQSKATPPISLSTPSSISSFLFSFFLHFLPFFLIFPTAQRIWGIRRGSGKGERVAPSYSFSHYWPWVGETP